MATLTAAQTRQLRAWAGTVPDDYDPEAALDDYALIDVVALELLRIKLADLLDAPAELSATADGSYKVGENIKAMQSRIDQLESSLRARISTLTPEAAALVAADTGDELPALVVYQAGSATPADGR